MRAAHRTREQVNDPPLQDGDEVALVIKTLGQHGVRELALLQTYT
jgi:hypothetical protein